MNDKQWDAIVIGAGHNGLTTAAYLAKAGRSVLVLEGRDSVGGLAATQQIFPGFQFDTGSSNAGMLQDAVVRDLNLQDHGLEFLESEAIVCSPGPYGEELTLWRDIGRSAEAIRSFSERDAERYPAFIQALQRHSLMLWEVLDQKPPEAEGMAMADLARWGRIALGLRRKGGRELMEFLRILPLTAKEFLDEWFENELLKGILAGPSIAGDLPGVQAAGTTLMLLYQQGRQVNGGSRASRYVKGGIGRLSESLAQAARSFGAEIRTATPVSRIVLDIDGDQIIGVETVGGPLIEASVVVSSADPRSTYVELLGGAYLDPEFMREVTKIRFQGATAKVNLALRDLPEFLGINDRMQLEGAVVISPSLDYLERAWDDAKYGRISSEPFITARIPTLLDPGLAPVGNHILSATVQYAPYHLTQSNWDQEREAFGDRVIAALSKIAPGLPDLVLQRQILTPLDIEREFGLAEGHIYQGQMALDQMLSLRPVPGYANYRTPYHGLYLCGAGTHPGGGVTGAPGRLAAKVILDDIKASR